MAGLLDLLAGAFGGGTDPTATQQPTEVAPVDVVAKRPDPVAQTDKGPGLDYNNSSSVSAVQQALSGAPPQGGSTNPGVYGLLPANLQHGTLRNVLGALGDAFLVGSGGKATYGPRMDRQAIGNAMAGYDQNPQAAIERIAGTGAEGAPEMADKLEQNYQTAQNRKVQMEYTQTYRDQLNSIKQSDAIRKVTPIIGGLVRGAKDAPGYTRAFQQANALLSRFGTSAAEQGLPDPQDWTPGMTDTYGMTSNNEQVSDDRGSERGVQMRGQDMGQDNANNRNRTTIEAANISANKPTSVGLLEGIMAKDPSQRTQEEQAYVNRELSGPRRSKPNYSPTPGTRGPITSLPRNINPDKLPTLSPAQAAQLSKTHPGMTMFFKGTDGKIHHN